MIDIDFNKEGTGLVPAVIQDATTHKVLMLGYMNKEAVEKTLSSKKVTFYSRSKERLWTKGETSGNFLELVSLKKDCDNDSLLIQAHPKGPTCHTGTDTCWQEENTSTFGFLSELENIISDRIQNKEDQKSYVSSLYQKGIHKVAQKVGEEAVEVVIEAMRDRDDLFLEESADLLFHYLFLLQCKGFSLEDVSKILVKRNRK